MTRINLIPVENLTRQHLIAEYRELPHVYRHVLRAQERGETRESVRARAPAEFRFGKGSILFFCDKIIWLNRRYAMLVAEMLKRGYQVNFPEPPWDRINQLRDEWLNDWTPSEAEIAHSLERIEDRVANPMALRRKRKKEAGEKIRKNEWDF